MDAAAALEFHTRTDALTDDSSTAIELVFFLDLVLVHSVLQVSYVQYYLNCCLVQCAAFVRYYPNFYFFQELVC